MTKFSYFAVIVNHDTGEAIVDDGMIAEFTNGTIWNDEKGEWEYPEHGTEEYDKDYEYWKRLEDIVEML